MEAGKVTYREGNGLVELLVTPKHAIIGCIPTAIPRRMKKKNICYMHKQIMLIKIEERNPTYLLLPLFQIKSTSLLFRTPKSIGPFLFWDMSNLAI